MPESHGVGTNSDDALDFLPPELRERWGKVRGWLLPDGARKLYELSATAPPNGRIVEIGSYAGKSLICIAWPHRDRKPEAKPLVVTMDIKFQPDFHANLKEFGLDEKLIELKEDTALGAGDKWSDPISFLYIDGHHGLAHSVADFVAYEPYVRVGGVVALDDTTGHIPGPIRIIRMALSSGAFERLDDVDGIAFLRKKKSLFPGLGRFPPEFDTVLTELATVAAWTGAMDLELLPSVSPYENLAALDLIPRMRFQRGLLMRYASTAKAEFSTTIQYFLGVVSIQLGELENAVSILEKLQTLSPDTKFATHALDIAPFVALRLGQCCDLLGQREKAINYYTGLQAAEILPEIREFVNQLTERPFERPKLRNDLLLREYVTLRQFHKYRLY